MIKLLRIWKYSLGSFSDDKTEPYDNYIAAVRTILFVSYLVTNCFIISGVIRHWDDGINKMKQNSVSYVHGAREQSLV